MRRRFLVLIIVLIATLAAPPAALAAASLTPVLPEPSLDTSPSVETSATRLAKAGESIVAISSGGKRVGSGVVIAPNVVITSLNILQGQQVNPAAAAIWFNGNFVGFKLVATDEKLKLALLSAELPGMKPIPWGKGGTLRRGDKVIALGMPEAIRDVIRVPGEVKAPALGMGGAVLTTDIPIDPLLEGGALITPDGKASGIIVSQGFGLMAGTEQKLGVAVTAEAARELYDGITQSAAEQEAADRARQRQKWIARAVLFLIVAGFVAFFWWFGRWYRRMAAREEAAEAMASLGGSGDDAAETAATAETPEDSEHVDSSL